MKNVRLLLHAWPLALLLVVAFAGPASARVLADSTLSDGWKLANGLEVRVRHVPGACGVAISLGYRAGKLYEPVGRAGIASLLAELENSSPAGDIPERSREEMGSLRPLGWGVQTNDHLVVITEIAAVSRFPGVLRQVATRMRDVRPTQADLDRARAVVRADFGQRQFGRPELTLYYRARDLALGLPDDQLLRRAAAGELDGLTLKEATSLLGTLYVPSNACLAITGNLENVDVRTLVEREFGSIPGGSAQPEKASPVLKPFDRVMGFADLVRPVGVLGLIAPALEDSLHPAFYLAMLVSGPFISNKLGHPAPPLSRRFQYSLLDEPDLVRFYPDPGPQDRETKPIHEQMAYLVDQLSEAQLQREALESVRNNVSWLIGGAIPKSVKEQMGHQPGALGTLATGMASRALWKGDAFWDTYLQRFENTTLGHSVFANWMVAPEHQGVLLLVPKP